VCARVSGDAREVLFGFFFVVKSAIFPNDFNANFIAQQWNLRSGMPEV
jgi:hypothetical protein